MRPTMSANCDSAASGSSSRSSATDAHIVSHSWRSSPGSVIAIDVPAMACFSNRSEPGDEALQVLLARPPTDRRADETRSREVAHDDAGLVQPLDDRGGLLSCRPPGDEGRALSRRHDVVARFGEERAAALGHLTRVLEGPRGPAAEGREQT